MGNYTAEARHEQEVPLLQAGFGINNEEIEKLQQVIRALERNVIELRNTYHTSKKKRCDSQQSARRSCEIDAADCRIDTVPTFAWSSEQLTKSNQQSQYAGWEASSQRRGTREQGLTQPTNGLSNPEISGTVPSSAVGAGGLGLSTEPAPAKSELRRSTRRGQTSPRASCQT